MLFCFHHRGHRGAQRSTEEIQRKYRGTLWKEMPILQRILFSNLQIRKTSVLLCVLCGEQFLFQKIFQRTIRSLQSIGNTPGIHTGTLQRSVSMVMIEIFSYHTQTLIIAHILKFIS